MGTYDNRFSVTKSLQHLKFRRQFLLGPKSFSPNQYWTNIKLKHELYLSVHIDLPYSIESHKETKITLIGLAIDPFNPGYSESDILRSMIIKGNDLDTFIKLCSPLAGRWVMIFQNSRNTYLFNDPSGLRQVFFLNGDSKNIWCASQPNLINEIYKLSLTEDKNIIRFLINPELARRESVWVGNKTLYDNCLHLMPNHYLDLNLKKQVRFYPTNNLPSKHSFEVIKSAALILQGIMESITNRNNIRLALTAGWDSRVLLAASKIVSDKIEYYIDRMGILTDNHPDIWVPQKLSAKLNLKFNIINSENQLPGWFVSLMANNVSNTRVLPKTRAIYNKFLTWQNIININGNISEVCRNYYLKSYNGDVDKVSSEELAALYGYPDDQFVANEISIWQESIDLKDNDSINILDLLYWEQKMGNWGAQYPSEQDIAIEELSPFNCRLLIETLLSSSREMRAAPSYSLYSELIKYMWPETMSVPIQSAPKLTFGNRVKQKVKPYISSQIIRLYKKSRK